MGDGLAMDKYYPVLRSFLGQQNFDDKHSEFAEAGRWMLQNLDNSNLQLLCPDRYQLDLFRSLAQDPDHYRIMVLHAAPGCGKTVFTVLLMLAICWVDNEKMGRRLHWMTAPTKTLVTELYQLASKVFPIAWIAPVGNDCAGNDRMQLHLERYIEELYEEELQDIRWAVDCARESLELVETENGVARKGDKFNIAKEAMADAYLRAFDLYNGDDFEESCQIYNNQVRLVISTTTYKLKHNAKERGPVNKIKQTGVRPGGHVADEVDASTLSTVVAASAEDVFLVTPTDPAQHMQGVNCMTTSRALGNMSREQNPNDWLQFADAKALNCTRRFGERGRQLLTAVLPTEYASLRSWQGAPDTMIDYVDLGWVEWVSAGNRAGAVVNADVFAAVLAKAEEMLQNGPTMILCVYAATRELLSAFFRKQGFKVTIKCHEGDALIVLSARQVRGGTSMNVIACFFRRFPWDDDYIGSCGDPAKTVVLLSRMTHSLVIFAESWENRTANDPMGRMCHHFSDKKDTEGYGVYKLCDFLETRGKYLREARNWVDWEMWPTNLFYDSDDELRADEFFMKPDRLYNATRTSLQQQQRNGSIPKWEKAEAVSMELFDHVSPLIFTVTVKAFTNTDSTEDGDQQSAASNMDSVKALFDPYLIK